MQLTEKDGVFQLRFRYNPITLEVVKQIPGRKWNPKEKVWQIPRCVVTERFINHLLKYHIDRPDFPPAYSGDIKTYTHPFAHQLDITATLLGCLREGRSHAIFAETGTGKTKAIIDTLVNVPQETLTLIVCPPPLLRVWKEEFKKHSTLDPVIIHGTKREHPEQHHRGVFITSYQTLVNDLKHHPTYDLIVFDESQLIKTPNSQRTKAAGKVSGRVKVIMTGTPYGNEYMDLWSQMNVLNPRILGPKSVFHSAFCIFGGYEDKEIVGYKDIDLLMEIIKRFTTIVLKKDCLDLPPKIYQKIQVGMTSTQEDIYNRCLAGGVGDEPIANQLSAIAKARQISSGFYYDLDHVPQVFGANKVDYLLSVPWDTPTIIWYNFNQEGEDIKRVLDIMGVTYSVASGETDSYEAAKEFENGDKNVLIAQMKTLQYGYTMNRAARVIYYSGCFSSLERQQSEDRCHRIGQNKSVLYIDLISSEVEEWMYEAIQQKKDVQQYILNKLKKNT